ncbi:MAG: ribonuclease P protein component [Bacteroidetes bacterium]|nr:ribonuclease P protein component [Bacteroidota bacterium]
MEEKSSHAEGPEAEKSSRFQTRRDSNSPFQVRSFDAFDSEKLKGRNTFSAAEKLKSKKIIEQLFKQGKSFGKSGFTLVYFPCTLNSFYPAQAGFTASKSNFKKAVDRNRIKRLMREVYRLNKIPLYQSLVEKKKQMALMFIYKGKELPDMDKTQAAITACLSKLLQA